MAAELLSIFEPEIQAVTLIPSVDGRFEITVNDNLLYSKYQNGRHAKPGEITGLVQSYLQDGKGPEGS